MAISKRGRDREEMLENIRADLDETVRLFPDENPGHAVACRRRMYVTYLMGARNDDAGIEPLPWMERASDEAEQFLDKHPTDREVAWTLALFNLTKGQQDPKWERDPTKDLTKAIGLYDQ